MHTDKAAALTPLQQPETGRHVPEDVLHGSVALEHLPDDILLRIIHWVPANARRRLRLVSTRLCGVVNATVTSIILKRKGLKTPGCVETLAQRYKGLSRLCISRKGFEHDASCHGDVLGSPLMDSHAVDLSAPADEGVDGGYMPDTGSGSHPTELCMEDVPFRAIPHVLSLIQTCGAAWQLVVDAWGSQGDRGWYLMRKLHAAGYMPRLTKLRLRLDEDTHETDMPWEEMGAFFTALTALTELQFDAACQAPALHWIAHLGSLRELYLDSVAAQRIVPDVPAACCNLLHLTRLEVIVKCELRLSWDRPKWQVDSLRGLPQLRAISISLIMGVICNRLLAAVCELTNLQSLCLLEDDGRYCHYGSDRCTGRELAATLRSLSLLTHLTLQRRSYEHVPLAHPNLKSLCLLGGDNWYKRPAPLVPSQLCMLTSLKTTRYKEHMDGWQHWTSLQLLHMSREINHEPASLVVLASLPLLEDLKLGRLTMNPYHEPGPCPQIPVFPSLQSIRCWIEWVNDDHLLAVCHAFQRAAHLSLDVHLRKGQWTAGGSETAFSKFWRAKSLQLRGSPRGCDTSPLADCVLHGLASATPMPVLTRLQFISCDEGLSTASIQAATAFPHLEELTFLEYTKDWGSCERVAKVTDLAAVTRSMLPAVDVQLRIVDDWPNYEDWL